VLGSPLVGPVDRQGVRSVEGHPFLYQQPWISLLIARSLLWPCMARLQWCQSRECPLTFLSRAIGFGADWRHTIGAFERSGGGRHQFLGKWTGLMWILPFSRTCSKLFLEGALRSEPLLGNGKRNGRRISPARTYLTKSKGCRPWRHGTSAISHLRAVLRPSFKETQW